MFFNNLVTLFEKDNFLKCTIMTAIYFKRLLIFCFILTSPLVFSQKSKVYKSHEMKMRIKFPCKFTSSVTEKNNYITYKMKCKQSDISYVATVTNHKLKMDDYKRLIKVSLDAFTKNFTNAAIVYTKDWMVDKKKGTKRQLLYKGFLLNYYVIINNNKQYQLIVFGDKDKSDEKIRDSFVNSFKML